METDSLSYGYIKEEEELFCREEPKDFLFSFSYVL
jgi:hypothetical protein